jgi:hypothetical protein
MVVRGINRIIRVPGRPDEQALMFVLTVAWVYAIWLLKNFQRIGGTGKQIRRLEKNGYRCCLRSTLAPSLHACRARWCAEKGSDEANQCRAVSPLIAEYPGGYRQGC